MKKAFTDYPSQQVSRRLHAPLRAEGLPNETNNNCFAIAVIQALIHHPRLANFLRLHHVRRGHGPRLVEHTFVSIRKQLKCPFCEFYELLVRYWTRPAHYPGTYAKLPERFRHFLERFRGMAVVSIFAF